MGVGFYIVRGSFNPGDFVPVLLEFCMYGGLPDPGMGHHAPLAPLAARATAYHRYHPMWSEFLHAAGRCRPGTRYRHFLPQLVGFVETYGDSWTGDGTLSPPLVLEPRGLYCWDIPVHHQPLARNQWRLTGIE